MTFAGGVRQVLESEVPAVLRGEQALPRLPILLQPPRLQPEAAAPRGHQQGRQPSKVGRKQLSFRLIFGRKQLVFCQK